MTVTTNEIPTITELKKLKVRLYPAGQFRFCKDRGVIYLQQLWRGSGIYADYGEWRYCPVIATSNDITHG